MTTTIDKPTAPALPAGMQPFDHFTAANAEVQMGVQLRRVRDAATDFRSWFTTTGTPDYIGTFDLIRAPYPTRMGLFRASLSPAPFLSITNRMMVVRWHEADGRPRTLLVEPTDHELSRNTPFYAQLAARTPDRLEGLLSHVHGDVGGHVRSLGIRPEDVDYITFDHLHTQDVRRWIGTNEAAADISRDRPVAPLFPNARLIVQRTEMEALADLHPLQRAWYQPDTYLDLRRDAIMEIDGDVLLGPGVALVATPGHTIGNHSIVLNTETGVWVVSENVIATECLSPEHSRIPGVRRYLDTWPMEVVLNANTIEATAQQYNSCIKEKAIADPSRRDPRFVQYLPSSELTATRLSPGTAPTFTQRGIWHGSLQASGA